jgi:U3 small nucleolar RNA-associated protein 7
MSETQTEGSKNKTHVRNKKSSDKKRSRSVDSAVSRKKTDGKDKEKSSNVQKKRVNNSQNNKKEVIDESVNKYVRGSLKVSTKHIAHKGLRLTIQEQQDSIMDSAKRTAETEVLLPSTAGLIETENNAKTYKITQSIIQKNVDLNTSKNAIDLQLTEFGPYRVDHTRNGRFMLMGGKKGHISVLDCLRTTIGCEMQLKEEVRDVKYLHNETMFAVAQQKYTYIYDYKGIEIHCMKKHERAYRLDFLPYHYLMTSVGHSGWIKWHDISIGEYVAGYQTGHGPCSVLKHNPINAVSHLGHSNGVVSLWSPAAGKSLVSMFCHKAPVTDLAIDREGKYMATAGLDGLLKIWDLRKFGNLHTYKLDRPATSLDISDRGLLAMSIGRDVQILKDAFTQPKDITYLKHTIRTPNSSLSSGGGVTASVKALASSVHIGNVQFRPLEDMLCTGHSHGITTVIVPGAGEPNFDSFENNPFMNPKQRREQEVQSLITKISHEMIALDASFVGSVDKNQELLQEEHKEIYQSANKITKKEKHKARGRGKISAKLHRKQKNVIDASSVKLREKLQKDAKAKAKGTKTGKEIENLGALNRFVKK